MSRIDFGRHTEDYASYRPGPPASFYARLASLVGIAGSRALDLGTGPGTLALELAARGSDVVGIDTSGAQIETAKRLAAERGLQGRTSFRVGRAERTGLEARAFDLATAGQSWHWFDSAAALEELLRVLKPGGRLAIVSFSYLARRSSVAADTEALILEHNPSWSMAGSTGLFPAQIEEVVHGGFELVEAFCYDHDEVFSHERWRGRMRTCNGVGSGGLPPSEVDRFDAALGRLLRDRYPDPLVVPHRVWCVVAAKPSGRSTST